MGWAGPGLETYTECHARLQQNVRPGFEPFVECQALGLEIILSKAAVKSSNLLALCKMPGTRPAQAWALLQVPELG